MIMGREERVRQFNLKSAQKENYFSPTESGSTTALSDYNEEGGEHMRDRRIRVIDRFGLILQIFAARAKSHAAQIQIELAWLRYARTLLARGGSPSFGQVRNMFGGNLMR